DFTSGLSPLLSLLTNAIWVLFILHFLLEFVIAPRKLVYLRGNWLTAISLAIPALRMFRILRAVRVLRAARFTRSVSMVRLISSVNRGMRALRNTFSRRGFGYAVALTVIVILAGSAGMLQFESPDSLRQAGESEAAQAGIGIQTYGESLWWTSMLLTTIGSEYWPVTAEGRLLAWLLALYGLAVFSYITATIASHFIAQDTGHEDTRARGQTDAELLREEVRALRTQIAALAAQLDNGSNPRKE
ncbi:MAG TPA: ion transporter, partial [Thermomicrobiales bacterium]|nr:ion transporter [Thermomicrobiales bacterium]